MDRGIRRSEVMETYIIDWPILAFFGFLFGGHAPLTGWWRSRAFVGGLIATGGFTASAVLSNEDAPDWMWMYYRDPEEMASITRMMPAGYVLAYVLSFLGGIGLRRRGALLPLAVAVSLISEVAVVAATWDRYHRIGTKEEWEDGTASELLTLKPEGKAKKVASYAPIVFGTVALGWLLARNADASSARR